MMKVTTVEEQKFQKKKKKINVNTKEILIPVNT